MNTIQGVVFDIDGVIVDSEPLHEDVLKAAIERFDKNIAVPDMSEFIGLSLNETVAALYPGNDCQSELVSLYESLYTDRVSASFLRTGIKEAITQLLDGHIPFGFVSSASKRVCESNVNCLNLPKRLPIVSADDVVETKPHPEPYEKMLSILDLKTDQVVVVEDSDVGITSAKSAGIEHILGWPHEMSGTQNYQLANKTLSGIEQLFDYLVKTNGEAL